jgi:PAT family beta-lactamase induction signal transducer AmpG
MVLGRDGRVRGWCFALLNNSGNAMMISLPFVLRKAGVPVPEITAVMSMLAWPTILFFLWSPVLDVHFRRRTWIILLSSGAAVSAVLAFLEPLSSALSRFSALSLFSLICVNPVAAAAGALAAVHTPADRRGSSGGWLQVGNLGLGAAGGALVVLVAERMSVSAAGWTLAVLTMIPAAMASFVPEAAPPPARLKAELMRLFANLRGGLKQRRIREGLVIFLCPTGAAAMMFLFSGIAVDYRSGAGIVAFSNGPGGGLLTMAGAMGGGLVAQRLGARVGYAVLGIASGLTALLMMLSPLAPMTFILGSLAYNAVSGCCFAAFSALALDLIGDDTRAAAGWYAAFSSLSNTPTSYMIRLDGAAYGRAGVRGMLGMDGTASMLSSVIMLAYFVRRNTRKVSALDVPAAG